MDKNRIEQSDGIYPVALHDRLDNAAPTCLYAFGDQAILRNHLLGLVCSIQCPGSIIVKTFDAIREIREAGVVVIGGFHSPMERQCFDLLLRGKRPAIFCAAKGLPGLRLGREARRAVSENRLLVISQFDENVRRTTSDQAMQRNDLVAALADVLWVPYAAPGGKTWTTIERTVARGQKVATFADSANSALIALGALPIPGDEIAGLI